MSSSEEVAAVNYRKNAAVYKDDVSLIKEHIPKFLAKTNLPKGLILLDDNLIEFGYNEAAGFMWVKRKSKKEHLFRNIRRTVSYEAEVTAFVEDRRLRKVTGVKSREMLFWVPVSDIFIDEKDPKMITFATPAGLSRIFPVSAFEGDDDDKGNEKEQKIAAAASNGNNKQMEKKLPK